MIDATLAALLLLAADRPLCADLDDAPPAGFYQDPHKQHRVVVVGGCLAARGALTTKVPSRGPRPRGWTQGDGPHLIDAPIYVADKEGVRAGATKLARTSALKRSAASLVDDKDVLVARAARFALLARIGEEPAACAALAPIMLRVASGGGRAADREDAIDIAADVHAPSASCLLPAFERGLTQQDFADTSAQALIELLHDDPLRIASAYTATPHRYLLRWLADAFWWTPSSSSADRRVDTVAAFRRAAPNQFDVDDQAIWNITLQALLPPLTCQQQMAIASVPDRAAFREVYREEAVALRDLVAGLCEDAARKIGGLIGLAQGRDQVPNANNWPALAALSSSPAAAAAAHAAYLAARGQAAAPAPPHESDVREELVRAGYAFAVP